MAMREAHEYECMTCHPMPVVVHWHGQSLWQMPCCPNCGSDKENMRYVGKATVESHLDRAQDVPRGTSKYKIDEHGGRNL